MLKIQTSIILTNFINIRKQILTRKSFSRNSFLKAIQQPRRSNKETD